MDRKFAALEDTFPFSLLSSGGPGQADLVADDDRGVDGGDHQHAVAALVIMSKSSSLGEAELHMNRLLWTKPGKASLTSAMPSVRVLTSVSLMLNLDLGCFLVDVKSFEFPFPFLDLLLAALHEAGLVLRDHLDGHGSQLCELPDLVLEYI